MNRVKKYVNMVYLDKKATEVLFVWSVMKEIAVRGLERGRVKVIHNANVHTYCRCLVDLKTGNSIVGEVLTWDQLVDRKQLDGCDKSLAADAEEDCLTDLPPDVQGRVG